MDIRSHQKMIASIWIKARLHEIEEQLAELHKEKAALELVILDEDVSG